jgi:hypothetical protein
MKTNIIKNNFHLLILIILPIAAAAQSSASDYDRASLTSDQYGAHAGNNEFTLGGGGTSNKDLNDSLGGLNFSLGHYLTDAHELVIRQSVNYSNPRNASRTWNGSTRLAADQFIISHGALRPFIGVNVGGVYGDNVRDTWAAGLEAGLKYYVQPRTFIEATVEYDWYFRHANSINNVRNSFDTGQWNWGVGIGFNF